MQSIDKEPVTIESIIEAVKSYQPKANIRLIQRAYELANAAHKGQKRVSGEEYIIHPLHVAQILTELHIDDVTISAALLHDVVEDTIYTNEQVEQMFGKEVAMLVDGVTKLGRIKYKSREEQQLENYRKMFLAMAKDIRVIMIKLADRLHNMRTLKYMREDKQKRIAKETIEIYAPLANRLGISNIKWELEDLCLRYLEPEKYYDLVESVKQKRQERQAFIDDAIEQIKAKLKESGIKAEISGRAKHFYSIYKKMKRDNKDISEIYDLSAVRVLVDTVKDCYGVLGVIHAMWKPIPGRFKDYIAMPKSNGYQSLHTTVMTKGYPLEIQIRTFKMHQVSEYGVAAHWKYKEQGRGATAGSAVDQKMSWLRQMVNLQQEFSDPREYFEALKVDIFSDEVFVFTPNGDVVDLPKGSIPIDFAYRIHTEIGHHCVGAKVNGKLVPLEYKLKNGDIVSIITNKASRAATGSISSPRARRARRSAPGSRRRSGRRISRVASSSSRRRRNISATIRMICSRRGVCRRSQRSSTCSRRTICSPPSASAVRRCTACSRSSSSCTRKICRNIRRPICRPSSRSSSSRRARAARNRNRATASSSRERAVCSCASRSAATPFPAIPSRAISRAAAAFPFTALTVRTSSRIRISRA